MNYSLNIGELFLFFGWFGLWDTIIKNVNISLKKKLLIFLFFIIIGICFLHY